MKTYRTSCDTCGWQSSPCKTPKVAAYSLRRHSCDKQRAKDAAARRRRDREAAIDRTPKPCHHKRTTHQHGTHACYVLDRCKCPPCNAANIEYERARRKLHAYGRWNGYTDAQPAREHLAKLRAQGMGLRTIGKRSGVSESTLGKIVYGDPVRGRGPSKRIRPATEAKILAIRATLADLADGAKIDGTGTRRRLQALVAIGWSQSRLAHLIGFHDSNFGRMIHGGWPQVEAATARRARDLYNQLWNTPPVPRNGYEAGAARRAERYAAEQGWVPPMWWDEDTIDDPAAQAAHTEPVQNTGRYRDVHDTAEDVAFLLEHEPLITARQAAERLGYASQSSVQQALKRADRRDLLDVLARNAEVAA